MQTNEQNTNDIKLILANIASALEKINSSLASLVKEVYIKNRK